LANRYGLSPAPIREALNQLEGEGLIIIRPNRGAVVRTIEPTFIQELYEIRLGLEPMLVAKCAACATPRDIEAIEAIEVVFERAVERHDRGAIIQQNSIFHATIYQIRPNIEALRLMSRQSALMCTIRHQYGFEGTRLPQIVEEHRTLIDALRCRDSAAAEAIERRHISHSLADILDRYRQFQNAG
jgi:DNA-binding GntR family transcriptional regulator